MLKFVVDMLNFRIVFALIFGFFNTFINYHSEAAMTFKNGMRIILSIFNVILGDEAQDKLYEKLFTNYSRFMAPFNGRFYFR